MTTGIIKQRHVAYSTSEHVISAIAKRATGHAAIAQQKLVRGYPNQALFDETFPLQLFLAKVGMQMGYLAHYIQQGNAEEAAPLVVGLRASLREWEMYA
jgi:hypothetical protein